MIYFQNFMNFWGKIYPGVDIKNEKPVEMAVKRIQIKNDNAQCFSRNQVQFTEIMYDHMM
jgi:hypothetical protein